MYRFIHKISLPVHLACIILGFSLYVFSAFHDLLMISVITGFTSGVTTALWIARTQLKLSQDHYYVVISALVVGASFGINNEIGITTQQVIMYTVMTFIGLMFVLNLMLIREDIASDMKL